MPTTAINTVIGVLNTIFMGSEFFNFSVLTFEDLAVLCSHLTG
jgi:hypothetical protein